MTATFKTLSFLDQTTAISFAPVSRQEMSRQANGRTIGKDFGSAIWTADYQTTEIPNSDSLGFEAELDALDGVINPFEAYDVRRPCPRLYRDGSAANGVLHTVNANRGALSLSGLNAGQVVSKGDYLSFDYGDNRALHRVGADVTADDAGLTVEFTVRPLIRPGWSIGAAVNLKAPRGLFNLIPGSVGAKSSGSYHSVITFQAVQYIE